MDAIKTRTLALPKIAFYADDFTGAAENMAQYHRHGMKSILFVDVPDRAQFDLACEHYDAVGIAGISRSQEPGPMRVELRRAFELFASRRFDMVQYKVCSTFDSSPDVGNLGVVLDEARRTFTQAVFSMMVAAPDFGRYTLFGNHFANLDGTVYRLDRHPSLSRHPITPMHEADLARHFELQRPTRTALVDIVALRGPQPALARRLDAILSSDTELIVLDALENADMAKGLAALVAAAPGRTLFSISSQGFAVAAGMVYGRLAEAAQGLRGAPPVSPILVLSGSGSLPSAAQARAALADGWHGIRLDTRAAFEPAAWELIVNETGRQMVESLRKGQSTIVYTALGADDALMLETQALLRAKGMSLADLAPRIGSAYASLARRAVAQTGTRRIVIAGGDTSSHAMRHVGADAIALRWTNFSLGAHISRMLSSDPAWTDCEVVLKGGQGGPGDLYLRLARGADWLGAEEP